MDIIETESTGARKAFCLADVKIQPGTRQVVTLPMPKSNAQSTMSMPIHVIHSKHEGPVLFVCAAVHGDELNGVEIIRRVLATKILSKMKGTLIAVPVVNPYGLMQMSRYLPDRRDLNRAFPGSDSGSLASRLANVFVEEIVKRSTHGIDLHTGSGHRSNLPQIRADLDDAETERLARSFGVPVLLNASLRDGSLRAAAGELGIPMLLYEAGEALRYDRLAIRAGVTGVFGVMLALDMLPSGKGKPRADREPFIARSSRWVRAPESGMLRTRVALGASVSSGDLLGTIDETSGGETQRIFATTDGVVIGRLELPIVHEGDAVYHIASFRGDLDAVTDEVESFHLDHSE